MSDNIIIGRIKELPLAYIFVSFSSKMGHYRASVIHIIFCYYDFIWPNDIALVYKLLLLLVFLDQCKLCYIYDMKVSKFQKKHVARRIDFTALRLL